MFWSGILLVSCVGLYAYGLYKQEMRLQEVEKSISDLNQKTIDKQP